MKRQRDFFFGLCLLLPAYFMWEWLGPVLWRHQSTGAFDAFVGLWILSILAALYGFWLMLLAVITKSP